MRSEMNSSKEDKTLYVKPQYKGAFMSWGKYGQNQNNAGNGEGGKVPKYQYYNRLVNLHNECHKIIDRELPRNNNNEGNITNKCCY